MYVKISKHAKNLKDSLFIEHLFDPLLNDNFMLEFIAVSNPK